MSWWRPQHEPFKQALEAARAIDAEALAAAIEQLPQPLQFALCKGPMPYRYDCRVCTTLRELLGDAEPARLDDPIWVVWAYHEVPKALIEHRDEQWVGEHANAIYERCLATYRAAGWDG